VQESVPSIGFLGAIAYGNGIVVAVDTQNLEMATLTSTNGVSWTKHTYGFSLGGALVFGNGEFLGSGLATSTDGVNWTAPPPLPNVQIINSGIFTGATYAAGRWLAVSMYESFLTHP
jgi:hypothetical protein